MPVSTTYLQGAELPANQLTTDFSHCVNVAGDTMLGLLTLAVAPTNPLDAATKSYVDSKTGLTASFGFTPGSIFPPFENFNSTGHIGFHVPDRFIWQRTGTSASDFADIQLNRTTAFTGGSASANLNAALRITTTIGANDSSGEYGILSQVVGNGATGNGNAYAGWFIAQKQSGSKDFTAGAHVGSRDFNATSSSSNGGALIGAEITVGGNQLDDGGNTDTFGLHGLRKGIHLSAVHTSTDGLPMEVSHGIWVGTTNSTGSGTDPLAYWDSVIGFVNNTGVRVALDTRGAVAPSGSTDPVAAVTMTAGHIVDFNGSASLTSNPGGRYFAYNSPKLQYLNAGTEEFSVSDTGAVNALASYLVNGTKVVGPRDTGWTAMTGAGDRSSTFAVASVTLPQLASRVAMMQAVLTAHGLLGP